MKTVITIEEQKDGKLGIRVEFGSSNNDFTNKEKALVNKIAKLLPKKGVHVCLQWPIEATLMERGNTVNVDLLMPGIKKVIDNMYPYNMLKPVRRIRVKEDKHKKEA